MNQLTTPLYDALLKHMNKEPISFHVPGHKNGTIFDPQGDQFFHQLLKIDATELTGLDDLHSPEEAILEAELLLAELFQTERSFFLVNGSTSGNLTMVMAACEEDQIVLVQRNCHKSIINALKLAKARPIFLEPEYDLEWKVAGGVSLDVVIEAIKRYPNATAIILTYPNYYGNVYDLQSVIAIAQQSGIAVLVDEAHGAHLISGEPFPPSAVQLGADIVVQSAHKTLPAMTMGSYLHFNSDLIKIDKVIDYLQMFQSSSPSYPIMASLDLARRYLATYNQEDRDYLQTKTVEFKRELSEIRGLKVLDLKNNQGDLLKVTVQSTSALSGFELQKKLETVGVYTELADLSNVLFVLPLLKHKQIYPFDEAVRKIKHALKDTRANSNERIIPFFTATNRISELAVSFKNMDKCPIEQVTISVAAGRVAAETIIPYPPGIPLLLMGEEITEEKVSILQHNLAARARFQGGSLLDKGLVKVYLIE